MESWQKWLKAALLERRIVRNKGSVTHKIVQGPNDKFRRGPAREVVIANAGKASDGGRDGYVSGDQAVKNVQRIITSAKQCGADFDDAIVGYVESGRLYVDETKGPPSREAVGRSTVEAECIDIDLATQGLVEGDGNTIG